MQLVDNLLHLKNIGKAKLYIERINEYLSEDLSRWNRHCFIIIMLTIVFRRGCRMKPTTT